MIINKKGTILPVTVIAMTIMMIMGLISLKMFQLRNVLMTEDILKLRLFYSAEGCVEIMRAGIDILMKQNTDSEGYSTNRDGYLVSVFPIGAKKYILEGDKFSIFSGNNKYFEELFDNAYKSYPRIFCRVYCENLGNVDEDSREKIKNFSGITFPELSPDADTDTYNCYRIVAESSATFNSSFGTRTMSSTVVYYFYTKLIKYSGQEDGGASEKFKHDIYFAGYRRKL